MEEERQDLDSTVKLPIKQGGKLKVTVDFALPHGKSLTPAALCRRGCSRALANVF